MPDFFLPSANDAEVLRAMVNDYRRKNSRRVATTSPQNARGFTAPDTYLVTPVDSGGIPAFNDTTKVFGKGDCDVHICDYDTDPANPKREDVDHQITVLNFTSSIIPKAPFLATRDKFGQYFPMLSGSVTIIRGRSQGAVVAGASGVVDNMELWLGGFEITGPTQTQAYTLPTDAFDAADNAWVWLIKKNDGNWGVLNVECIT